MAIGVLGGPIASLLLFMALLFVPHPQGHALNVLPIDLLLGPTPIGMLGFANAMVVAGSVLPRALRIADLDVPSDALRLLRMPFLRGPELDLLVSYGLTIRGEAAMRANDLGAALASFDRALELVPTHHAAASDRAIVWLLRGEALRALEVFRMQLEDPSVPPALKPFAANNFAWACFMTGDQALLPDADRASMVAMQSHDPIPELAATRGAILVWLGRVDEGLALLQKACAADLGPAANASVLCCCALALIRQRAFSDAAREIAKARELDPECRLLARTERELDVARSTLRPADSSSSSTA